MSSVAVNCFVVISKEELQLDLVVVSSALVQYLIGNGDIFDIEWKKEFTSLMIIQLKIIDAHTRTAKAAAVNLTICGNFWRKKIVKKLLKTLIPITLQMNQAQYQPIETTTKKTAASKKAKHVELVPVLVNASNWQSSGYGLWNKMLRWLRLIVDTLLMEKMDEWTNQYEFPWKTNGTQLLKICDEKENKN